MGCLVMERASRRIPRAVVLDAETSPSIDVTGAQMLAELANNLRSRGTRLLVARDVGQVRDVLRRVEVPEIWWGCTRLWTPRWKPHSTASARSRPPVPIHRQSADDGGIPHPPAAPDTYADDTVADGRDAQ